MGVMGIMGVWGEYGGRGNQLLQKSETLAKCGGFLLASEVYFLRIIIFYFCILYL